MQPEFNDLIVLDVDADDGLQEDYAVRVLIAGSAPLPLVEPFRARFDDEPVEAVALDMHGTGFGGYLKNEPAEGAKLFVTFEGQEELDTGITFTREIGPIA